MYEYRTLSPEQKAEVLRQRELNGYPRHRPPHWRGAAGLYLITAANYEHHPYFQTPEERRWVLGMLLDEFRKAGVGVDAWVMLPNHYHSLVECETLDAVSRATGLVHGRTSCVLNRRDGAAGRQVWYRFSDRRIRDEAHYYATLNYIHYNPVKHGYAKTVLEWECSSVHWYLEESGIEWLRSTWRKYPVLNYGRGWDW